jgi:outer membrane beta-barrel protein
MLLLLNLAYATDPVDIGVLKNSDIRVVQRRLYTQENRLETAFGLGVMPFDLVTITPLGWAGAAYHLSESMALEGRLGGGYGFATPFFNRLGADGTLPESYRYLAGVDANFQWTPVYGKISLMGKKVVHSDLYLFAGFGITMEQSMIPSDNKADGEGNDPAVYLLTFAPTIPIGFGSHFFVSDNSAFRLELRDAMLIENRKQTSSTVYRHSIGFQIGYSIYSKKKG